MGFNPDPSEQAQEIVLNRKFNKDSQPSLILNNNIVYQAT